MTDIVERLRSSNVRMGIRNPNDYGMTITVAEANAAADEIERLRAAGTKLRRAWLRVIQQENSCPATGGGCFAKRCGCLAEMEMLMSEDEARAALGENRYD